MAGDKGTNSSVTKKANKKKSKRVRIYIFIMDTFEQLPVWQEARILVKDMYTALEKCRDFGFRDQLQRAAIFITNNIAEGFERVMLAEKIQFYRYAK